MEIKEVKDARELLANKIGQLIQDFEWDTDTVVSDPIKIVRGQDELNPRRIIIKLHIIIP